MNGLRQLGGERACLSVEFEPSVGGEHQDRRRAEWVFRGEQDAEMVESSLKLRTGRTADGAVPFLGFLYEGPTGEG